MKRTYPEKNRPVLFMLIRFPLLFFFFFAFPVPFYRFLLLAENAQESVLGSQFSLSRGCFTFSEWLVHSMNSVRGNFDFRFRRIVPATERPVYVNVNGRQPPYFETDYFHRMSDMYVACTWQITARRNIVKHGRRRASRSRNPIAEAGSRARVQEVRNGGKVGRFGIISCADSLKCRRRCHGISDIASARESSLRTWLSLQGTLSCSQEAIKLALYRNCHLRFS